MTNHFPYRIFRSPDGAGGASGVAAITEGGNPVVEGTVDPAKPTTTVDEPIVFTKAELDLEKNKVFQSGYNKGRDKAKETFKKKAVEHGYENIDDLDEFYEQVLSKSKQGTNVEANAAKRITELESKHATLDSKYKRKVIEDEIARYAAVAANPKQVAKLLQDEYVFKVVEQDGREVVRVFDPTGAVMHNDLKEVVTEDVVKKWLNDNPHHVKSGERPSMGAASKTGAPATAPDTNLSVLVDKPLETQTPEEQQIVAKAFREGKIGLKGGVLTVL